MAMLKSDMQEHIRMNLSERRNLDSTRQLEWLNWALRDTAAICNWRSMKQLDSNNVKTTLGGLNYSMPANTKDILEARYSDGNSSRTLTFVDPAQFRKTWPKPEQAGYGYPEYYTWEGDLLKLYPIPSIAGKAIELYRVVWPEEQT
jgi:hypothetical protein